MRTESEMKELNFEEIKKMLEITKKIADMTESIESPMVLCSIVGSMIDNWCVAHDMDGDDAVQIVLNILHVMPLAHMESGMAGEVEKQAFGEKEDTMLN